MSDPLSETDSQSVGLLAFHHDQLRKSCISDDVIRERGYKSVSRATAGDDSPRDVLRRAGVPGWVRRDDARYPGLLIPQFRPTGELAGWAYRPDTPGRDPRTGKLRKYIVRAGRPSTVDVHPRNAAKMADPAVPLWITEGVKKADSLTTAGACAVALAGVFNWRTTHGTLGDWEDIRIKGRKVLVCFDADARVNPNVARAMGRLGRWLKSKGASLVLYVVTPAEARGTPVKGCDDFLAAGGTLQELQDASSAQPPEAAGDGELLNDAELAETAAAELLEGSWCWTSALGWLRWDGARWASAPDAAVTEEIRAWAITQHRDARESAVKARQSGAPEAPRLHKLAESWWKYLGKGRLEAIASLARGILLRDAADFDAHPDLLNVANGVVDLRTGELLPHDPELLMTRLAPTAYRGAGYRHADWDAALRAVPRSVRDWYCVRMGQALTGHMTPDDLMIVQRGSGENGKGTVMAGVQYSAGDYFHLVPHRALLADAGAHPTELMDFKGARIALMEETPEERRLSVARLKMLTGTLSITARKVHKDSVTFAATHSLFLSTNYRLVVQETDSGTWRRLAEMYFPYHYVRDGEPLLGKWDRRGDATIRERIKQGAEGQHSAALAWMVRGSKRWYASNREMPPLPDRIRRGTLDWRAESDLVLGFASDQLVFDRGWCVLSSELRGTFNDHVTGQGHHAWGENTFASRFGQHEFVAREGVVRAHRRVSGTGLELSRRPVEFPRIKDAGGDGKGVPAGPQRLWLGVRFRTEADDEAEEQAGPGTETGKSGHGP